MELQKALVVIVWRAKADSINKKVLILRLIPRRGAFWQPVTGKVEEGESYLEGALREATEETGLRFERQPQYLGLEHEFAGREGKTVRERCFYLPLFGGKAPPEPVLDGREHDAYEWVTPAEAVSRVKWPNNKLAIERAAAGLAPLYLNARGEFYQDGEEITHARTLELFHTSLSREGDGGYVVRCEGEELDVVVEDLPRFVRSYERASGLLKLVGGGQEKLDPATLRVRGDNSFVCTLADGWEAVFLSSAYYEIAKDVSSVGGKYVLHFLGRDHKLRIAD
ncbi:MAG TPA: NUDIX domain-containing protein [Bdellovibrionota bacterium]|jgi:8-oxo-dGTP pyrophosphatase MutT (NUDIX family)